MKEKVFLVAVFALIFGGAFFALYSYNFSQQAENTPMGFLSLGTSFEQRRANLLGELTDAVEEAKLNGKYKCCIEPACTMCYLGNWIWKDGTCDCDGMIAAGEFDKVCPQCKKGLEEGRCISNSKETEVCTAPENALT